MGLALWEYITPPPRVIFSMNCCRNWKLLKHRDIFVTLSFSQFYLAPRVVKIQCHCSGWRLPGSRGEEKSALSSFHCNIQWPERWSLKARHYLFLLALVILSHCQLFRTGLLSVSSKASHRKP